MVDYYALLAIEPSADAAAIRKAYRREAMKWHPDRGGDHDRMVLLNEAWEILSDPDRRRRYDEARIQTASPSAQAAASADADEAHRRAEQYPRQWSEFDKWLNGVAGDFSDAQHGSMPVFGDVNFPVVSGSFSGCLFIAVGAILAGFFGSTAAVDFCERNKIKGPIALALIVAPVIAGAWVGAGIHRGIGGAIRGAQGPSAAGQAQQQQPAQENPPPPSAPAPRVLACEKCGQKMRVPSLPSELLVTCKSCGHKFSFPAAV